MDERSIRVELAGRAYPLTIHQAEEENVRRAVDEINESITRLKENYPLTDKQDMLAMAAMEVAVRAMNTNAPKQEADASAALTGIEKLLAEITP
ncbi:MAG: cell division protein ZapA [Flavobacteriales bacterium]|nr:cell division protein ZapA [Flavobacteriales bacterium]MCC6938347.1 cell division protein ZapA [Flavobacteriales bacterium]